MDDLKKFHSMLTETTGLVKKAVADGKTLDQIKSAGVPDRWKDWGSGFYQYRSLARNALHGRYKEMSPFVAETIGIGPPVPR